MQISYIDDGVRRAACGVRRFIYFRNKVLRAIIDGSPIIYNTTMYIGTEGNKVTTRNVK